MTTISRLFPVLFLSILAPAVAAPAIGPLRAHPENPRYFTDGAKRSDGSLKAVFLTGAHTWNNLVDMGRNDPSEAFDFPAYLDFLEEQNHNFIRLWAWDSVVWDTRANGRLGKDFIHHVAPQPWIRSGPGAALDGKPKFDLAKFNPQYFERMRDRVSAAGQRGIYVSVMLFEGWGLMHGNNRRAAKADWAWQGHPFHPANNINGIDARSKTDSKKGSVHSREQERVNEIQAAYIRKVVDTVNDLDNVLYEVINEGGQKEWDWWVVETVRSCEKTKPKQHPIGITGHGAERVDSMLASPADWVSPGRSDGFAEDPPAWNEDKVSLLDTDHVWGVGGNPQWVWKSLLRGHNPLFMDPYDGLVLGASWNPRWEPIRAAMGHARRLADRIDLASMRPSNSLSSTEYSLANPGAAYLFYQPRGGEPFSVEMKAGTYDYEWVNAVNGSVEDKGQVELRGGSNQFGAPTRDEAILYLKAR